VNTSIRRTGSDICLCSEIDMCRSPHPLRQSPFRRQTERCSADTAYNQTVDDGRQITARVWSVVLKSEQIFADRGFCTINGILTRFIEPLNLAGGDRDPL